MLASVASNLGEGRRVRAYVLESALSRDTKEKVAGSCPPERIELTWIPVEPGRLAALKGTLRSFDTVSIESYHRLLLPELLPANLDKVIYLDCDLVVNRDLGELWDLDASTTSLLAVSELTTAAQFVSSKAGIRLHRELGLARDLKFFNSGVMVINLRRWRERQVSQQALTYVREAMQYLRWHDQEALNAVLAGDWAAIDPRWNVSMHVYRDAASRQDVALTTDAYIVHYNSAIKPWHYGFSFGRKELFFTYLDATAWRGWRPARPPRPALARWKASAVRALRKRSHAISRLVRQGLRVLGGWWTLRAPLTVLSGRPVPVNGARELRLLMVIDRVTPDLPDLLRDYLSNSTVDRVLIAASDAVAAELGAAWSGHERVHIFPMRGEPGSRDVIVRQLLHHYGRGHWCAWVNADELLLDRGAEALSLKDLCSSLEASGFEALACRVFTPGSCERLRIVVCDPVNGRVFCAPVWIAEADGRIDELKCCSRVALLKYRSGMVIGRDLRAVHGARLTEMEGVLVPRGEMAQAQMFLRTRLDSSAAR